jgi:hypothetical protein
VIFSYSSHRIYQQYNSLVAQKLGIKKVIFLRQTDRYITINDTTIKNITQIIDTSNAKSVFFPSPMELHIFIFFSFARIKEPPMPMASSSW